MEVVRSLFKTTAEIWNYNTVTRVFQRWTCTLMEITVESYKKDMVMLNFRMRLGFAEQSNLN